MKNETTEEKGELVEFKSGDRLFGERDPSGCMYIIKEGQVQVYLGKGDNRIPLAIVNNY